MCERRDTGSAEHIHNAVTKTVTERLIVAMELSYHDYVLANFWTFSPGDGTEDSSTD